MTVPNNLKILLCRKRDLLLLERLMFSHDSLNHTKRYQAQQDGAGTYLIAWQDGAPVGHLNLRWQGAKDPEVQRFVTDTPELSAIGVREEFRSSGIGTALIKKAEQLIRKRGFQRVGLAVGTDNHRARQLYLRLGYQDWGRGSFMHSWEEIRDGQTIKIESHTEYMLKDLK